MSGHREPLESGTVGDISRNRALYERLRQFHWEYFSELAYQRSKIYDSLKNSLRERAEPFKFLQWQRVVKYKYSLDPLGVEGSLKDPGGRFNIGAIDKVRYPIFPALYVASDKGTALAEILGRNITDDSLTVEDLALTRPDSISIVSISGTLDAVLDARNETNFSSFVGLIKGFRISAALSAKARALNFSVNLVKNVKELSAALTLTDWRRWPTVFDVPAASQVFGRIVYDAQIEGILYNSALTGKPCIALFPQNFQDSNSFIELDDPAPPEVVKRRVDSINCGE